MYFMFCMTEYFPGFPAWAEAVHALSCRFGLVSSDEQCILQGLQGDNTISHHVYYYYYYKILSIGLIISCSCMMN